MVPFAEQFPDEQIVAALLRQLRWMQLTLLLAMSVKNHVITALWVIVGTMGTVEESPLCNRRQNRSLKGSSLAGASN
jgi:hypothetical protein